MAEREILFRGKRLHDNKWIYGNFVSDCEGNSHIIEPRFFYEDGHHLQYEDNTDTPVFIIPETVGQYTGLTDKNGVRIFEGDILVGFLDEEYPEHETVVVVEWHENMWVTRQGKCHPDLLEQSDLDCFEVVGNIHDNPELLETAAKPAAKNIAQSGLAPATENFELMEG